MAVVLPSFPFGTILPSQTLDYPYLEPPGANVECRGVGDKHDRRPVLAPMLVRV